jgi:hypothetical protein
MFLTASKCFRMWWPGTESVPLLLLIPRYLLFFRLPRSARTFSQNQHGPIFLEYEDHESVDKAERTEFRVMLQDAAARKFDALLFWSLDRLTREGTLATLTYLELIESYGVHWRSLTEPWIDSAGPFRDVIISLLASLAKQERVRISERVRAGLTRAKQYGTRSGRAIGRPVVLFPAGSGSGTSSAGTFLAENRANGRREPDDYPQGLSRPNGRAIGSLQNRSPSFWQVLRRSSTGRVPPFHGAGRKTVLLPMTRFPFASG